MGYRLLGVGKPITDHLSPITRAESALVRPVGNLRFLGRNSRIGRDDLRDYRGGTRLSNNQYNPSTRATSLN
jgi:hypothetical protein